MIFNSLDFLIFALVFFGLWPYFKKEKRRKWGFITVMSFIFYAWWDWRFIFLIILSGLIDYYSGLAIISRPKNKRFFLILSLFGNLGGLAIFKYSTFFAQIAEQLTSLLGVEIHLQDAIPEFALILPVGISFYTFQSMSYTIDIYRGRLQPTKNILHFFSYLAMFPQLVAGPIIRAKDLLKQLAENRKASDIMKWNGVKLIVYGLFQKTVIADNLAFFVDSAYEGKTYFDGTIFWWVVLIAFAFQIYCDFCGYSLIARGLAKYMGYHFKMNFNHPYLASGFRSFWTKWHISLSTWFRDYVYIALGGSKSGFWKGLLFMWIVMLVSGLWHGANYTFIIWGGLHALYLSIERIGRLNKIARKGLLKQVYMFITFIAVVFAWNYFRADDVFQANDISRKLLSWTTTDLSFSKVFFNSIFFLSLAFLIEFSVHIKRSFVVINTFQKKYSLDLIYISISIVGILFFRGVGQQFIYFQF